jgi:hypothetical protein
LNRSDAAIQIALQDRYVRISDSIDNAVMAATALDVAMPAVEAPTGMEATSWRFAFRVAAHVHPISRTQDIPAGMSPRCNGVIG